MTSDSSELLREARRRARSSLYCRSARAWVEGSGGGVLVEYEPSFSALLAASMSARDRYEPVRRRGVLAALAGCGDEKDMVRLRG